MKLQRHLPRKFLMTTKTEKLRSLAKCAPLLWRGWSRPFRKKNVLMLHFGRCGSTVVGNLLRQHSEIVWDSEVLQFRKELLLPECALTTDPKRILWLRSLRAGSANYGVEIKPLSFMHLSSEQLDMSLDSFFDYIQRIGITDLIFVTRKHFLRQLISLTMAVQKDLYEVPANTEKRLTYEKIRINCDATAFGSQPILDLFNKYDEVTGKLQEFGNAQFADRYLEIEYSDQIMHSPTVAYERIEQHLGLTHQAAELRNSRVNRFPMDELVEDWDAVTKTLQGSKFAWMCDHDES